MPLVLDSPWGETYYAVETLADRLREVASPTERRVVVLGPEVPSDARDDFAADLGRLAVNAARGFGFAAVEALVPGARTPAARTPAARTPEDREAGTGASIGRPAAATSGSRGNFQTWRGNPSATSLPSSDCIRRCRYIRAV
jgi:hypothetical protein